MVRIAVTGAAGNVGRETLDALADHDVTPLTHREHDDIDGEVVDVTDADAFAAAVDGHDVLVHLAANPSPDAEWKSAFETNIGGTYNAYEAAAAGGLDRVVFASSNHAVGMYNVADPGNTENVTTGPMRAVDPDDPPRPDSYYGVSKVAGEALGSYYADRHGLDVVNLRIGWLMTEDQLRETQDADPTRARFARAMWLSPRDCRDAMRKAATASLPETPVTLHAVSRNDDCFLSITETTLAIGYAPRDDASEVLGDDS